MRLATVLKFALVTLVTMFCGFAGNVYSIDRAPSNSGVVLFPAKVPPQVGECSLPITRDEDGSINPLTCPGKRINVLAWKYYVNNATKFAKLYPEVEKYPLLEIGRHPKVSEIDRALCTSGFVDNPMLFQEYNLSTLYYGWRDMTNPQKWVDSGGCIRLHSQHERNAS